MLALTKVASILARTVKPSFVVTVFVAIRTGPLLAGAGAGAGTGCVGVGGVRGD